MHILFVHQSYPSQFGPVAEWMARSKEHQVTFVSTQPNRWYGKIENIQHDYPPGPKPGHFVPWTREFPRKLRRCRGVINALKRRPDIRPDLVVGHSGFGSTLFIPEVLRCPIVNYFEYFHDAERNDMLFRSDFEHSEQYRQWRRASNAMFLLDLQNCSIGYSPTQWQRSLLPAAYQPKVDVIFDGIDTSIFRPSGKVSRTLGRMHFPSGPRIITYVSRAFELIRGFDIFMKLAKRIYTEYPNVLFIVAGHDRVEYGTDAKLIGCRSLKKWVLDQDDYDMTKFHFVGWLKPTELAQLYNLTDLHIYLTTPFPPSWSLFKALACGATVLASNTAPVQELISHERTGLLADFFDIEGLAREALKVLKRPTEYRRLGEAAALHIQQHYSADATVPKLVRFFERAANSSTPRPA